MSADFIYYPRSSA